MPDLSFHNQVGKWPWAWECRESRGYSVIWGYGRVHGRSLLKELHLKGSKGRLPFLRPNEQVRSCRGKKCGALQKEVLAS